jgi:hypothetical protein
MHIKKVPKRNEHTAEDVKLNIEERLRPAQALLQKAKQSRTPAAMFASHRPSISRPQRLHVKWHWFPGMRTHLGSGLYIGTALHQQQHTRLETSLDSEM